MSKYLLRQGVKFYYGEDMDTAICATFDNFTVRLAKNTEEIEKAQKLRYEHLLLEFNKNHSGMTTDCSEQDAFCDHLIVTDVDERVVGTYRLLTSERVKKLKIPFCCEGEFDLAKLCQKENVLEIGRAVVHPDYRNAGVFRLLWTGIMDYCKKFGIEYLFGTASYHGTDPSLYKNSFSNLYFDSRLDESLDCPALEPSLGLGVLPQDKIDLKAARSETPSLIRAYIAIGAKAASSAFIDYWFNCIDILTVVDLKRLVKPVLKRMFGIDF